MAAFLVVDSSLSPRPEIGGLTGLETSVWCTDPGELVVGVSIRGYRVEAHATVASISWTVDGTKDIGSWSSSSCESLEDPPVTWMPETKGPYVLSSSATWGGYWTVSLNGAALGSYSLGSVTVPQATIDYPVDEYRGVLTG